MKGKQNIEDAFRSGFEGFTQTPSDKVWNGINKKLIGPRFESMYKNAFNGFKMAPSEQTWRRIAAAVWFNRFIHFSPFSFNIYYLGIIVTAVVGTVVTVNQNRELDFVHFSETFDNASQIKTEQIVLEQTAYNDWQLRNANPDDIDINSNQDNIAENINNNPTTVNYNNLVNQDINTASNNNNNQTQNTAINNINSSENNNNQNNINIIENNIADNSNIAVTNNQSNNLYFKLDRLIKNNTYTLTYKPTPFDIADNVINGIPEQDVITYDTLGVDYHGNPILSERSYFAIDAYFSPFFHNYNTALLNSELETNYNLYKDNINPELSYSAGLGFAYSYKNFRLETGIGYLELHEAFNASTSVYEINTHTYYDHFNTDIWEPYTVLILDLDEYLQGNIVYIQHTDSILTVVPDSTLVTVTDSTLISKENNASSSYKFIDVPLVGGYEFKMGKVSITPKAGIIGSLLINRNGTYFDMSENNVISCEHSSNTKFLFDYYTALNLQYQLGEHTSIYLEPYLRADINSMYDANYAIDQKSRKYGLRTGIYFKF